MSQADERLELLDALKRLLPSQLEEVIFRSGVDAGHLPSPYAPASTRASALVQLCEAQGKTAVLWTALERVGGPRRKTSGSAATSGSASASPQNTSAPSSQPPPELTTANQRDLRQELLQVAYDPMTLRMFIADAGLPQARINLGGSMEIQVHNTLDYCKRAGGDALQRLLAQVRRTYPDARLPMVDAFLGRRSPPPSTPQREDPNYVPRGQRPAPSPAQPEAEETFDAFISHSSRDKPWVTDLVTRLQGEGLKIWFDAQNVGWGESIQRAVVRGLKQSRHVIVVLSPDAIDEDTGWVELEQVMVSMGDPANRTKVLLPLLYRDCEIPMQLRPFKYLDVRGSMLDTHFPLIVDTLKKSRG